jgi:hypothetical protein|tara:strand:+ start:269 stop:463 length:195 start_codon:yes stop_codon:yes gene_type:complete
MAKIYDFIKYLSDRQIDAYETDNEDNLQCFECPDCQGIEFILMLDETAACSGCGLTVTLGYEEE